MVMVDDIRSIKRKERIEGAPVVFYNNREIRIPFHFVDALHNEFEHLRAEIAELRTEVKGRILSVNDKIAEAMIVDFLHQKQKNGVTELDVLDVADVLHLPYVQISKIMKKLKARGIHEID